MKEREDQVSSSYQERREISESINEPWELLATALIPTRI